MSAAQRPQRASKPCLSCGEAPESERARLCFPDFLLIPKNDFSPRPEEASAKQFALFLMT